MRTKQPTIAPAVVSRQYPFDPPLSAPGMLPAFRRAAALPRRLPGVRFVSTTRAQSTVADGIPNYLREVKTYDNVYLTPSWVTALDRNLIVTLLLFANDERLIGAYLDEVRPGDRVWQAAHVYGDLVSRVADKVGPTGAFHLTDITPIQIAQGARKLAGRPWASATQSDAATWAGDGSGKPYDLICSFFLLHEVPDDKKREIVDNMLGQLPRGKKALFVDYHGPERWQPVRQILKLVNRYLEPFADSLWQHDISAFASRPGDFVWTKRTFFGGVYQSVTVQHKADVLGAGDAGGASQSGSAGRG